MVYKTKLFHRTREEELKDDVELLTLQRKHLRKDIARYKKDYKFYLKRSIDLLAQVNKENENLAKIKAEVDVVENENNKAKEEAKNLSVKKQSLSKNVEKLMLDEKEYLEKIKKLSDERRQLENELSQKKVNLALKPLNVVDKSVNTDTLLEEEEKKVDDDITVVQSGLKRKASDDGSAQAKRSKTIVTSQMIVPKEGIIQDLETKIKELKNSFVKLSQCFQTLDEDMYLNIRPKEIAVPVVSDIKSSGNDVLVNVPPIYFRSFGNRLKTIQECIDLEKKCLPLHDDQLVLPYGCKHCDQRFVQIVALRAHITGIVQEARKSRAQNLPVKSLDF